MWLLMIMTTNKRQQRIRRYWWREDKSHSRFLNKHLIHHRSHLKRELLHLREHLSKQIKIRTPLFFYETPLYASVMPLAFLIQSPENNIQSAASYNHDAISYFLQMVNNYTGFTLLSLLSIDFFLIDLFHLVSHQLWDIC
jgi:hypothetical protein